MSNFIYNSYCVEHPGVVQFGQSATHSNEQAAPARAGVARRAAAWVSAKSAWLLSAVAALAAVMVVLSHADEQMQSAWLALIAVAAVALVLFTKPARRALKLTRSAFRSWEDARQQALADEVIWNAALQDARLMADLARAMDRQRRN